MAWRIVKQPNGLYARFSDVVDNFTDFGMTRDEAIECCIDCPGGMGRDEAEQKVARAEESTASGRWDEAFRIIKEIHGQEKLDEFLLAYEEEQ